MPILSEKFPTLCIEEITSMRRMIQCYHRIAIFTDRFLFKQRLKKQPFLFNVSTLDVGWVDDDAFCLKSIRKQREGLNGCGKTRVFTPHNSQGKDRGDEDTAEVKSVSCRVCVLSLDEKLSGWSRIFQRWRHQPIIFGHFPRKLHKIEINWTKGRASLGLSPFHPPMTFILTNPPTKTLINSS